MWAQNDSGEAMDWEAALAYAENSTYAGYGVWRLLNVKELQSIADYSGAFPAIDSIFAISEITNEAGNADYPYVWAGTSNPYIDPNDEYGYWYAWYFAFGYAVDWDGNDIHGAGAVRFDTKAEGGATGPIGYALDGYGIYGEFDAEGNDPGELDECRGQTDEVRGYHYHAASPGENMFIGCFHGLTANQNNGGGVPDDPPAPGR